MVLDGQVRKLWKLLEKDEPLCRAALKVGMDEKTARKYRDLGRVPSEVATPQTWRTREDPFAEVWPEVHEQLSEDPRLQAKALFEWLQRKYPGRFQDGQLRTFQRGVKGWRATQGPNKEVFFAQVHHPGRLCASDFTHMGSLQVTVGGQSLDHLVYHFVLTYSNWEWATVCYSESFESLSEGLQNALWRLGGIPERHRTDRLSAAVNNLSERREFSARYRGLMNHLGMEAEKIQARQAHENGDVESLHRHFKEAVDQALRLRGSREFASVSDYQRFLEELLDQRNAGRRRRLEDESARLRPLPSDRQASFKRCRIRVDTGSLIRVDRNLYSVQSRLIGEPVDVRLYADYLEVWYGQRLMERLPRLRGRRKHQVDYRHIIDWLVRKPGAFENYRYREDLFPTSRFRAAYDILRRQSNSSASREYLAILHLAARENESLVDDALRVLLNREQELTAQAVEQFVRSNEQAPAITEVEVEQTDLSEFDSLLDELDMEVCDEFSQGCENALERTVAAVASAGVSGVLRGVGSPGGQGDAELRTVPAGVDEAGERTSTGAADRTPSAGLEAPAGEEPGDVQHAASVGQAGPPSAFFAGWGLP